MNTIQLKNANTDQTHTGRTMLVYTDRGQAAPDSSSGDGYMVLTEVPGPAIYEVNGKYIRALGLEVEGELTPAGDWVTTYWLPSMETVDLRAPRPRTELEYFHAFNGFGGSKGAMRVR